MKRTICAACFATAGALAPAHPVIARDLVSVQMKGVAPVEVTVDADAAARRLAKGVTFATISNQDRSDFDEQAFRGFHQYLAEAFPLTHQTLEREILGEPRAFSLLYTWAGKDPELPSAVLLAPQDVVPVVPGTETRWEHGPFSGDIADGYVRHWLAFVMRRKKGAKPMGGFSPTRGMVGFRAAAGRPSAGR